jgi:hypothetical protein
MQTLNAFAQKVEHFQKVSLIVKACYFAIIPHSLFDSRQVLNFEGPY